MVSLFQYKVCTCTGKRNSQRVILKAGMYVTVREYLPGKYEEMRARPDSIILLSHGGAKNTYVT